MHSLVVYADPLPPSVHHSHNLWAVELKKYPPHCGVVDFVVYILYYQNRSTQQFTNYNNYYNGLKRMYVGGSLYISQAGIVTRL